MLRDLVAPLVREALDSGAADRWFFLRYADPNLHIRLRLHGAPDALRATVRGSLQERLAPLLADGLVWCMTLDTYEREVERYGGSEGIVLAEQVFHADSEAVLEILERLEPDDAGLDERWRLTLTGVDRLLDDLGFDLASKASVAAEVRDTFAAEFRADETLMGRLGERFRRERTALANLLDPAQAAESSLAPRVEALARRSVRIRALAAALRACQRAGRLSVPLPVIAASLLHMHANRLLRAAQREHELVLSTTSWPTSTPASATARHSPVDWGTPEPGQRSCRESFAEKAQEQCRQ